jgi:flagellar hook-associated protein 2
MGISPLIFTGISQFSDDFQTILSRSLAIASIPLQEMQNEQSDLLVKKQLLTGLRLVVAELGSDVAALGAIGESQALAASSSNTSRVTVNLNGATQAGTYVISDITSVARASSETTQSGYATADETAVSTDGIMELVIGSDTYTVDVTGDGENNLNGIRDAINALGAGVSASVLNTGTGETPYYLSLTANATGENTLQLRETAGEAGTNILTADNQGANAIFKLNGLDVTKSDNVVSDVVPGLTFTIVSTTEASETVTLTLASSRGELATALATLAGHDGSGSSMNRLSDLGIEFDDSGVMSFDQDMFYALSDAEITAAFEYLGSETTGFGALSANFTQISDPATGLIKTQQDQYDVADDRLETQITNLSARIEHMQTSLSWKLQQADVLIAQLDAQQTMLDACMEGLNYVVYGRRES